MQSKRDCWTVRDSSGVLHAAQLCRFYKGHALQAFQISTACHPVVKQILNHQSLDWGSAADLPATPLGDIVIVEWRVREDPTCLACLAVAEAFRS